MGGAIAVIVIINGGIGFFIGSAKGKPGQGFFLGLLLGPLGWLIVAIGSSASQDSRGRRADLAKAFDMGVAAEKRLQGIDVGPDASLDLAIMQRPDAGLADAYERGVQAQREHAAKQPVQQAAPLPPAPGTRACPWCAEEIQRAAIICKHCGRDVAPTSS